MGFRQKNFTLIELMVIIAIMAIMAAIAIPNFAEWVAKRRVASVAEKVASLHIFLIQWGVPRRRRGTPKKNFLKINQLCTYTI